MLLVGETFRLHVVQLRNSTNKVLSFYRCCFCRDCFKTSDLTSYFDSGWFCLTLARTAERVGIAWSFRGGHSLTNEYMSRTGCLDFLEPFLVKHFVATSPPAPASDRSRTHRNVFFVSYGRLQAPASIEPRLVAFARRDLVRPRTSQGLGASGDVEGPSTWNAWCVRVRCGAGPEIRG